MSMILRLRLCAVVSQRIATRGASVSCASEAAGCCCCSAATKRHIMTMRRYHSIHSPFGSSNFSPRSFLPPKISQPTLADKPKLILISGCTGTGKSTLGMSVALDQGILRCVSTDTIRQVMRSFISPTISPALHRSSYSPSSADGTDDPAKSWMETCSVLAPSVEGLVDDAMKRGISLVLEGVHVVPSTQLIHKWEEEGGLGVGCLLTIKDEEAHRALLERRGVLTGKSDPEKKKLACFDRVRAIQDEMIRLSSESGWVQIKQRLEPDPLELVAGQLWNRGTSGEAHTNNFSEEKAKDDVKTEHHKLDGESTCSEN